MTLKEAEMLALKTLKQVMEEKIKSTNVEIASIATATRQFHIYSPAELEQILATM